MYRFVNSNLISFSDLDEDTVPLTVNEAPGRRESDHRYHAYGLNEEGVSYHATLPDMIHIYYPDGSGGWTKQLLPPDDSELHRMSIAQFKSRLGIMSLIWIREHRASQPVLIAMYDIFDDLNTTGNAYLNLTDPETLGLVKLICDLLETNSVIPSSADLLESILTLRNTGA